jgi:hypothetical protein
MSRDRDYQAEYDRRVARGIARGLSRSQARGHPGIGQVHISPLVSVPGYDPVLEEGIREIREGGTITATSRRIGVSSDRLRRYLAKSGVGVRERGRWRIGVDRRPRRLPMYSRGRTIDVIVPGYAESVQVGRYMAATGQFQVSNDPLVLAPFRGDGVRDVRGQFHPFETDPNTLYRLMAAGPEPFELVYRIVV